MSRTGAAAIAILVSAATANEARAATAGLNLGAPVYDGVVAEDALKAAIATGAPHIRVNFRIDQWSSPTDTTQHNGKTFFEVYDHVVDAITSQGLEVYGVLNDEIASGAGGALSPTFEAVYAANVLAVVDRYKDRVRVWETLNEPNDWAGGSSARIPASTFATLHARVYDDVKRAHAGDACWDVGIVTGPLFSFDDNSSADYLDATIAAGRSGGRWKTIHDQTGSDPMDGVGYHLYVAQGASSSNSDVGVKAGANIDAIDAVLAKYGISGKKLWISEIGWTTAYVDAPTQAARLDATFSSLGDRPDIASLQWFTVQDFPNGAYGLLDGSGNARPSRARFVAAATTYAPALAARLDVTFPSSVAAGSKVVAKVVATNLGTQAWTGADGVRLGAAAGCPSAWATNAWTWDAPAPGDGYVKSATDARRFIGAAVPPVAQGSSTTFDVALTAPSTPGKARFAARMVADGVAWFGSTAIADVDIGPAGAGGDGGVADPDAGGPGGPSGSPARDGGEATDPGSTSDGSGASGCALSGRPGGGTAAMLLFALGWLGRVARRRTARAVLSRQR